MNPRSANCTPGSITANSNPFVNANNSKPATGTGSNLPFYPPRYEDAAQDQGAASAGGAKMVPVLPPRDMASRGATSSNGGAAAGF